MTDTRSKQIYDLRGNPIVAVNPETEVALGMLEGHNAERKFGFNLDIDAGTEETIWAASNRMVILPQGTAETMSLVSTSADDTAAGTGARTVRVIGVDINFKMIEEIVILAGLTPVVTAKAFFMVNRMRVASAGSGKKNVGAIIATATTAATVQAQVPIGYNTTQKMIFCVPAACRVVIQGFVISATKLSGGALPRVTARLHEHVFNPASSNFGTDAIIFEESFDTAVRGAIDDPSIRNIAFLSGTVLEWTAITDTANTIVFGTAELLFVNDIRP